MGHVVVADVLRMLDCHDFTQFTGVQNLFDGAPEGGIAEHMTDGDLPTQTVGLLLDGEAFGRRRGDGLLQQNVIALIKGSHHMTEVITVHTGDDGGIGHFLPGKQVCSVSKTHGIRYIQCFSRSLQTVRPKLCHSSNGMSVLHCPNAVGHAPGTGADQDICHGSSLQNGLFLRV